MIRHPLILCLLLFLASGLNAQEGNTALRQGNQLYQQKKYDAAARAFSKALSDDPKNPAANFNLGDAQFRNNKLQEAENAFGAAADNSPDKEIKEKASYNKGVALIRQQKLQESIAAWKESLKLDPNDKEARENLQKALLELKQLNKENKEQKQNKQQKQEQPKQQQSKLSKQQVDQLLKALQQKEKEIQQRLQKGSPSPNKPDKDW